MLQRTEGIVLKTYPYGEADLIVTYLTKDFGIIRTFAKSPRKTKSRFGSSLEPLTCSRISFWGKEDSAMPRLTQADILFPFQEIRDSYACFLKVLEIVELTLGLVAERDANVRVYNLLLRAFQTLGRDCGSALMLLYYKLKLLEMTGYLPKLDDCGRCGRNGNSFYLSVGAILCESCSRGVHASLRVSPGTVQLYSHLLAWEEEKIERLKPSSPILRELSALIDEHTRYIMERNLKTKAF